MQIIQSLAALPADLHGGAVAIGNFDGVHLGHRALVAEARRAAQGRAAASPVLAMSFEPHPRRFFMPDAPPFRLDGLAQKARLLAQAGADALLALPFDAAFAALGPQAFVADVLRRDLGAAHVVVGYDFTFGKGRAGDTAALHQLCAAPSIGGGIGVSVVQAQGDGAGAFSSSRIRALLQAGEPAAANVLLGRPWEIEGRVLHGDKRGRTIGFPTANVDMADFLVPKLGVYAVRTTLPDGRVIPGVANLGLRPTFGKDKVALEVNLFDFAGDLYDQILRVAFIGFIRPEQKFAGLDALKAQIAADAAEARRILAA